MTARREWNKIVAIVLPWTTNDPMHNDGWLAQPETWLIETINGPRRIYCPLGCAVQIEEAGFRIIATTS